MKETKRKFKLEELEDFYKTHEKIEKLLKKYDTEIKLTILETEIMLIAQQSAGDK